MAVSAISFVSCSDNDEKQQEIANTKVSFLKWLKIDSILDALAKIVNGRVDNIYIHLPDGTTIEQKKCVGLFGTCTMTIQDSNGNNISNQYQPVSDNMKTLNIKLIKSNAGILLAANKNDKDAVENLFYADNVHFDSECIIEDEETLKYLGVTKPIGIVGDYEVYQSEDYVFNIIQK